MKEFKPFRYFFLVVCIFCLINSYSKAQNTTFVVQNINVTPFAEEFLIISWSIPSFVQESQTQELKVFRNTRPIDTEEFLTKLEPIATLPKNSISYTDKLTDFKNYYYAVAFVLNEHQEEEQENLYYDQELDNVVNATKKQQGTLVTTIIPGSNATLYGTHIAGKSNTESIKTIEQVQNKYATDDATEYKDSFKYKGISSEKNDNRVTKQTEQEAKNLITRNKSYSTKVIQKLEPYIFVEDEQSPTGGDDYLLYEIVQNYFAYKKYKDACKVLKKFLAQNRNTSVTQRATFYLGQSYYFCNEYINALQQFLKIDEAYPILYAKWTDSCIDLME